MMKVLKFILILLLGFFIGILSTLAGIVGGGYYVVTNVTPEDAEVTVQNFVPEFTLPEQFPESLLSMTFMEIFNELADIAGNLDSITLNELQDRLGYDIPLELEDGTDISFLLQPVMDIPISTIPENMDLIMNNVTMDSLISLGLMSEEDLPELPLFSSAEALNTPLMSLFTGMGSIRISDVITLYTGDYYPNDNGNYVLSAGSYAPYDPEDPAHEGLTRYTEIYVFDSEGDFVLIEDNYVSYNESEHAGLQRYSSEIVPSFTGDLIISGAVYISYDPGTHSGQQRYILPEASPRALLAIGDAYVNAVPDDDPTGLTVAEKLDTLQVKDILDTTSGPIIMLSIADAYIGDEAPEGEMTVTEIIDTLKVKDVIEIYEADVYEDDGYGTLVLVHEKSNNVLIAIKEAYIGSEVPESDPTGMTISETMDTVTLGEIIDITEDSSQILITLQDTTIGELDETIESLQLKDAVDIYTEDVYDVDGNLIKEKSAPVLISLSEAYIGEVPGDATPGSISISDAFDTLTLEQMIDIYEGTEYVHDDMGIYYRIPATFTAYDELSYSGEPRYRLSSSDNGYYPDEEGAWIILSGDEAQIVTALDAAYISYMAAHPAATLPRFSLATESSTVLKSLRSSTTGTLDSDINTLELGAIIDIDESSSRVLQSLKNTSINNLDSDLQTMTLYQAITIYDGTEYVLDPLGEYVIDGYELYDPLTYPEHEHLTRYTESEPGVYIEDEAGLYVHAYVAYSEPAYLGYDRYTHSDPSSLILRSLKDAEINNMDATINTLQLKDVIEIDGSSSKMLQAMQNAYVGTNPPPGEKTLSETLDELTIGDMIDVTPDSPKVLRKFADSTVINLEDTINSLQLKDVIDIYDKIAYEEDENGFYVFDSYEAYDPISVVHQHMERYSESGGIYTLDEAGGWVKVYVAYDPGNPSHAGLTRYTRTVGVDELFGQYYAYDTDGLYCSVYDTHVYDTYDLGTHPEYADYPRYRMVDQSSTLLISLQDTYIYDEGTGETLTTALDNLTLVEILGTPAPGSLLEAISYEDDGVTEVLISNVEARVQEVMVDATLAELAGWGIIAEPADWGAIDPTWTLSELFNDAITAGGGTPGTP